MHPETGFAYVAWTKHPELSSHSSPAEARILENGVPLPGPANALHDDIRQLGLGRYSFWHGDIYFSTPDNSDPCTNGRIYTIQYVFNLFWDIVARFPYRLQHVFSFLFNILPATGSRIAKPALPRGLRRLTGRVSEPIIGPRHEMGFAYVVWTRRPELSSHSSPSEARILENGVPLPGPANALHDDIRRLGLGRYSFWHGDIYFSTSDNSDPCKNGRIYTIQYVSSFFWDIVARFPYRLQHIFSFRFGILPSAGSGIFRPALSRGVRRPTEWASERIIEPILTQHTRQFVRRVSARLKIMRPSETLWEVYYWFCFSIVLMRGKFLRGVLSRRRN
jgi:hypothetical protein